MLLGVALLATVAGLVALWPRQDAPTLQTTPDGSSYVEVTATDVDLLADAATGPALLAETDDGATITVQVAPEYLDVIEAGDRIRVLTLPQAGGTSAPYVFVDLVRGPPMALLAAVMGVLVLAVARLRGLGALAGLAVSVGGVLWFTVPALLTGGPPLPIALVTASALMFVLLYLAHGVSIRTSTALLGTLGGLLATGALDLPALLAALVAGVAATWWLARKFGRRIGGYTGDCLGAVQQLSEAAAYIAVLATLGQGALA